jgi:transcriptional regulator with XRE-family HTH domain
MPTLHGKRVTSHAMQAGDRTHADIARKLRLTQSTVSRLLSGTTSPSLRTLLRIRHAYGIPLDDQVVEDGQTATPAPAGTEVPQ